MNSDDEVLGQSDSTVKTAETDEQPSTDADPMAQATGDAPFVPEPAQELGQAPASEESDDELFRAFLDSDMPSGKEGDEFIGARLERGQIVKGAIASITDTEIMVDIGAKSEGVISGREFEEIDQETRTSLRVGEDVYIFVLTPEDRNGHAQLSLRRAMEEQDWIDAENYRERGEVFRSKITAFNKGGLIVRFGKVRGFVPASQISRERRRRSNGQTPDERWGQMVGEDISVKVIEVDRGRNRLILSERAASKEMRAERRAQLLESLEVGQIHTGRVISLADFGAFIDLGGADGLIHLSELSWRHVTHPKEVLKVGDEVEVEIIHIDRERQRIGLSRKNRLEDPWDVLASNYSPDQLVQGTITKLTKFGAFARLVEHPEIEGLIHISELSDRRVEHPREVVNEGEVVTLRIIRIDAERRRMGLSLKRVDSEEYLDGDWRLLSKDELPDKSNDFEDEDSYEEAKDDLEADTREDAPPDDDEVSDAAADE
jgi:small subunit ribosomal protein S1